MKQSVDQIRKGEDDLKETEAVKALIYTLKKYNNDKFIVAIDKDDKTIVVDGVFFNGSSWLAFNGEGNEIYESMNVLDIVKIDTVLLDD